MYTALPPSQEQIKEKSYKIAQNCLFPRIKYPKGIHSYGLNCEPSLYTVAVNRCIKCLEIEDINLVNFNSKLASIETSLETTYRWIESGKRIFELGGAQASPDIPPAYFIDAYELEQYNPEKPANFNFAYFLLAMEFLADYKETHLATYAPQDSFKNPSIASELYKQSIDSIGCLLNAQACLELGTASLERTNGNVRFINQGSKLNTLEKQEANRNKGLTDTNKARDILRAKAQEIALKEWNEDVKKIFRIGKMSDHVMLKLKDYVNSSHSSLDIERGRLLKNIPRTTESMKKWLRPIAPEYASTRGNSTKS